MSISDVIAKRKSIRAYQAKPVEPEKLETIVAAGNSAPIFGEIHITVIESSSFLEEINQVTLEMMKNSGNDFLVKRASTPEYNPLYGAPVLILLSSPNGNDDNGFNMANVSCAAENMLLAATALELGSCFVMGPMMAFSNAELLQKTGIPQGNIPLCGILVGYSNGNAFSYERKSKENVNYCR